MQYHTFVYKYIVILILTHTSLIIQKVSKDCVCSYNHVGANWLNCLRDTHHVYHAYCLFASYNLSTVTIVSKLNLHFIMFIEPLKITLKSPQNTSSITNQFAECHSKVKSVKGWKSSGFSRALWTIKFPIEDVK